MGYSLHSIKTIQVDNDLVEIFGQVDDDNGREAGYAIAVGSDICVSMGYSMPNEYSIREAIRKEREYMARFDFSRS